MSWERRSNGKLYYYRAKRCGGQLTKTCCGTGAIGELAAGLDARQRDKRRAEAEALRAEKARVDPLDCAINELV